MSNSKKVLDLATFIFILRKGISTLIEKYKTIDELNVFPVPDGDTGTNMKITLEGADSAIKSGDFADFFLFGKVFNRGLLMNARGNSGVILSQIWKGFFKPIPEGKKELTVGDFIECMTGARETAYKAVITPVEGTILTVIRIVAETLVLNKQIITDFSNLFKIISDTAEKTLLKTPDLLPELKEANVVDSGGFGLCRIFEGMNVGYNQEENKPTASMTKKIAEISDNLKTKHNPTEKEKRFVDNNDGFGYCNEFIMDIGSKVHFNQKNKDRFDFNKFKKDLTKVGDSIVCVMDGNLVKVHIHSLNPWNIFASASKYGEFLKVKVENMTEQWLQKNPGATLKSLHENNEAQKVFKNVSDKVKVIATVPSKKIGELFEENVGLDTYINTETTGNPSVEMFFKAFVAVNSSKIILIIDDSNYLLSAQQAKELLPKNISCEIYSARSITNSYYLCTIVNYSQSYSTNKKNLWNKIKNPLFCKISRSVKDGRFNKIRVKKGEYIGITNKKIVSSDSDLLAVTKSTIKWMLGNRTRNKECIIFVDTDSASSTVTTQLVNFIKNQYKITAEIHEGNIANYPYTISFIS